MPDHESYKKILNLNRIRTDLKNNMIHWVIIYALNLILLGIPYALIYCGLWYWLRHWGVHAAFAVLGLILLHYLAKWGRRICTFARPLVGGRYTVVEDEIKYIEENAIKGMHLAWHGRHLRWEPIIEHALFLKEHGRLQVDRWELKDHDGGDKIYLVIPEYNPCKILLYYNADHYELKR